MIADVKDLKYRLSKALEALEEIESNRLPQTVKGASMKQLLLLEKTARIFVSHCIPLEVDGIFDGVSPERSKIWRLYSIIDSYSVFY